MARQNAFDRGDGSWQDLVWASIAAFAIIGLLVASVALIWMIGRSPMQTPALAVQSVSTPTPRALVLARVTSTPVPTPVEPPTATTVAVAEDEAVDDSETPVSPAVRTEVGTPPGEDAAASIRFEAPDEVAFATLASGSWSATERALINSGSSAIAEPWLQLTPVSGSSFAVEAEIRVSNLLSSVCDQSFGLVGGNAETGAMFGGGLFFPCGSDASRARLTDVSVWEDGYNADPVVAEEPFDPEEEWHTYRFEVREDQLRLIVDGVDVVSGAPGVAVDYAETGTEAGLWAQGVGLEVRKISVQPLPPD